MFASNRKTKLSPCFIDTEKKKYEIKKKKSSKIIKPHAYSHYSQNLHSSAH